MNSERDPSMLQRLVDGARARLRINDALRALSQGLPALLVVLCCVLGLLKLRVLPVQSSEVMPWVVVLGVALLVSSVLWAALRTMAWQRPALEVDRHYALSDRLTSALEFQRLSASQRSPLMSLAIEEATALAQTLESRHAVRVTLPTRLGFSGALLGLLLVLTRFEVGTLPPSPVTPIPSFQAFAVEADDLQMMREIASDWERINADRDNREVAQRFNQLVSDIAQGKLDRHQVLERLEALERTLAPVDAEERSALEEGLQGIARELQTNPHTKQVAATLANQALTDAEKALRELAEKLKNKRDFDRGQLENLRRALQSSSTESSARQERLAQQRQAVEQARQRLLQRKGANTESDANSELSRQERQLERLRREQRRAEQAATAMSELDRQLAEAARKLFEEQGGGSEQLQKGADELARMAREQLSEKEKAALKKQLEALRELLRQQGKAGKEQKARYREFARRARGESDPSGASSLQGLRMGSGGSVLPGLGVGQASASAAGDPGRGQQGQTPGQGGDRAGRGTDNNLQGDSKALQGQTQDVSAAGIDTGQGASTSSVVYGAAERGFVGGGYKRVYTEYKTVAEETLEQDRVPAGYQAHVRRYFQLIRPRD